jgi:putative DNA primase/helicase
VNNLSIPEALFELGYVDLVEVIPPGAQMAPSSTIPQTQVGKAPGRRLPNGMWVGYDWRKFKPTVADVRKWTLEGANIGLKADAFPGVDIDITDPALAKIVEDVALAKLGKAYVRTGKAPKRLLMYRTDEAFGRMRLWFKKDGETHLIEILGQGQQYLVYGTHPGTMKPYEWSETLGEASTLTTITRKDAAEFLDYLAEALSVLSVTDIVREGDGKQQASAAADQLGLRAPSLAALREAVALIPNDNDLFPDRTAYLKMAYAIRAAGAEDIDEAYSIFGLWAGRWEGNDRFPNGNAPETVRADWRRIHAPFAVGWPWISEMARQFGFNSAALEFDTVEERPADPITIAPLYSDQWLADKVVEQHRGSLRFLPQKGEYISWNKGKWQPDAELLAEDTIKHALRTIANVVTLHGVTPAEKKAAEKTAQAICSAGKVAAVSSLVKSDRAIAVRVESLDHDAWLLNTPTGMVDLRTGRLGDSNPDALTTKSTSVPPDFGGPVPNWLRFLAEATGGDADLVGYLQRLAGYTLTGSTREQQLTFIYGPGGNGKSVFLNVLSGILGDYARVASMDTFIASNNDKHTTDVAMLTGARLVTASETEVGKRWNESRLKSFTGGEAITARFMRQDNFTYMPQFKLIFVGNNQPEIRNVDIAMRRRIQMVPFTVTPAVVDKELAAKLRDEWPAILAWMIEGCLLWQQEGLNPPKSVQVSTDDYFAGEDSVGRWLDEACVIGDPTSFTSSQSLYLAWREWANRNGEHVGSMMRLSKALISRKFERHQQSSAPRKLGFLGITLKPMEDFDDV